MAGLVAAHELRAAGLDVVVLEASDRVGGVVRTDHDQGWQFDWGPQTMLLPEDGALRRAIGHAGLTADLIRPLAAGKARYVLQGRRLRRVPLALPQLLGWGGLARLFGEAFVPRRREGPAESVREFALRRFGRPAADVLFDAFTSGIWAGDPGRLELRSAFPSVHALEVERGSLVRAFLRGAGKRRRIYGFAGGLGRLPQALGAELGAAVQLARPALGVARERSGWRVDTPAGPERADAVLLTAPADAAARLLRPLDPELGAYVDAIPYAAAAVVSLGYRLADMRRPPRGFGFLIPHREGKLALGCLFPASVFPGVAPAGHALLRVIAGGRRNAEAVDLPARELVDRIRGEVEPILGIDAVPRITRVFRWPRAIPQYERGHRVRLEAIEARLVHHPGLFLAGNPYRGISLPDVAERAAEAAAAIARHLGVGAAPQASTLCALCRLPLNASISGQLKRCAGCEVLYHRGCLAELGGCATPRCPLHGLTASQVAELGAAEG